jgi:hypothetical protein
MTAGGEYTPSMPTAKIPVAPPAGGKVIPMHVITCGGSTHPPVVAEGFVYAQASASCSDRPDLYSAVMTVWAYHNGKYDKRATRTWTQPPVPNAGYGIGGGACFHGWIYHSDLELNAFHGNWIHEIFNSRSLTLC